MKKILAVGVVAAAMFAAGGPAKAQWTGFYVGANIGGAIGDASPRADVDFSPTGYFATTSTPSISGAARAPLSPSGFTGGGQGGFNWQVGSFVVGAEADFGIMSVKDTTTNGAVYPCCAPTAYTIRQSLSTDWLASVRPRVGFAGFFGSKSMIYLTGGLAVTNAKFQAVFNDTFATAHESATMSKTLLGYTVGGGGEFLLGGGWSLKGEYLFNDFGTMSQNSTNLTAFTPPIPFPTNIFHHGVDIHMHVLRAGMNFHF